ncbi:MAG: sulfurtransferase complex subunit TusB [Methanomassiliicoccales archaeon]|jgi:sulfur relay protein TusB/DsrH|nr:sulfurtransferase complex subunit TusB [Methanomassiliicoccales archaeon]
MPSVLFVLLKSPSEYHSLEHLHKIAGNEKRAAVLFEDAVYFAVDRRRSKELLDIVGRAYIISDDLKARGFSEQDAKGYEVIDYPAVVDLIMEEYDQIITV